MRWICAEAFLSGLLQFTVRHVAVFCHKLTLQPGSNTKVGSPHYLQTA